MKLRVLGKTSSINVRKVLWTLSEIGAPFDHEPEWGDSKSLASPEFRALNPNALVPVIVDDNGPLWESNTICRYLAVRHRRSDLLPLEATAQAQVEKWMDWQATELNSAWRYAFMALVRKDERYRGETEIQRSIGLWNDLMKMIEEQLGKAGQYILGDRLTLTDIVIGLSAHRWEMTPMERVDLPGVSAWLSLLRARPQAMDYLRMSIP